jgi:hypothetical protein
MIQSYSSRAGICTEAAVDPAVVAQWQDLVDLLEDAARACEARSDLVDFADQWMWLIDGETIRDAAEQLRRAARASLPVSFPVNIVGPAGRTAAAVAALDTDPMPLLEQAWERLDHLPDDPTNVELLVATLALADVIAQVRNRYE